MSEITVLSREEHISMLTKLVKFTNTENAKRCKDIKCDFDYSKTAMLLGSQKFEFVEVIPVPSISLGYVLGCWGFPKGSIIEVYGPESSGKSTLCLHACAETQKLTIDTTVGEKNTPVRRPGVAAYIDAEHTFDIRYAKSLGIDIDTLLFAQPSCAEEALNILELYVKSRAVDLVIVDSVAALVPLHELKGSIGDSHVGIQARLMSQAMRMLTAVAKKNKVTIIFVNQIRDKIGVMFGDPRTTPGGRALKFFSSIRLDLNAIGMNKDGSDVVSRNCRIKCVKNKVAPPFRECEVEMTFGQGFAPTKDLVSFAIQHDILTKTGNTYFLGDEKVGVGVNRVIETFTNYPHMEKILYTTVADMVGIPPQARRVFNISEEVPVIISDDGEDSSDEQDEFSI